MAPVLLSIEAIIGAGKSTLLEELAARRDVVVVREPVDLWQQPRGDDTLLSRYYADQKANAFMFQTYAMMSHVEALRRALSEVTSQTRAIIMERSWLSARHCFVANLRESGHIDELEDSLHEDLFNWGLETWPKLDGVVFIDLPVGVAQGRVAKRGRTAESAIPSEYQDALAAKHRQWLQADKHHSFEGAVLSLDGSQDKHEGAVAALAERVMEFANSLLAAKEKEQEQRTLFKEGVSEDDAGVEVVTPMKKQEPSSKRKRRELETPVICTKT